MWNKRQQRTPFKSTDSLIGHGGTLEGKVICDTNLRIEGTFSGEIICSGVVTVGEDGMVRASIEAKEIVIAGKVYGDVISEGRLIMTETGQLHGNIVAGALSITEGSILNGSITMQEQPTPVQAGGLQTKAKSKADKAAKRSSKGQESREAG